MEPTKQPVITSANQPKPPVTEPLPTPWDDIVAKPLGNPDFTNMRHKNSNVSVRWVNADVGEKHSSMRFNQAQAQGFVACSPTEVVAVMPDGSVKECPPALIKDGRVIYGDVILMKLPRNDYLGALKFNAVRSIARVKKAGVTMNIGDGEKGKKDASANAGDSAATADAFAGITRNPKLADKIRPYIPPNSDLEEKVGGKTPD